MLTIAGLVKRYGGLAVLDHLDLEAGDGEIIALIGPSGCGKTTLLNIVAGLVRPDGGILDTGGARVGYVFQEDRLLPWLTVEANIAIVGDKAAAGEVNALVSLVGLDGFGKYYPDALSIGMRQRAAIARAYHRHCDLLLLDEPFKSLDYHLREGMLETLLAVWRERRNTIVFVTHDIDEALAVASRVFVLAKRPARTLAVLAPGVTDIPRNTRTRILAEMEREIVALIK